MWNVKRVLILVAAGVGAFACYAIYALFLGGIDGMRPFPESWLPSTVGEIGDPPPPPVDQKLAQCFGPNCDELRWPLRLWLADKGIAFAAGDFSIEKNGKVKLAPFSAALYHKSKGPGAFPEISTIRCDVALITLDRQVSTYSELNNREVIGVEMIGRKPGIALANNRRTAEKGDDVDILITNGNLFYKKSADLIWTDGVVCVRDYQSKPPTEIRGKGFEMHLAKGASPNPSRMNAKVHSAKPSNDNGGIERLRLHTDVEMHFWVDSSSGFLGGVPTGRNAAPPPAKAQRPERAHIHVKTGGPFVYDLVKEKAWFESPPPRDGAPNSESLPIAPDQVHVERQQTVNGKVKFDQLICDYLELNFRKRASVSDDGAPGADKEIDSAKATRRDKNEVVLSLDSEQMAAYGTDLSYRAGDANSGPVTILKGEPLKTVKDGHKMVCKELHLHAANRAGEGQKVWARGPGQIDLIDGKNPQKPSWPTHVLWNDNLTIVREKEGGQVFDLLTVAGDASFIDDQQKQELHGEKIHVWILQTQESAKKAQAVGTSRQELHRVLAVDRVRATSPEFVIRQANRLYMVFLPQMPEGERLPDTTTEVARPAPPQSGQPPAPAPMNAPAPLEKKAPPIELTATEINGTVFTLGNKKDLQELIAKGGVHVFQQGDKPGEKRIDITGQLLTVKYAEKGHTLVVHGDAKTLARLELGEMVLWGPLVSINRGENKARVDGRGAMQAASNKNLDGTEIAKSNSANRITIWWNKSMDFDGRSALFQGGVQAQQQSSDAKLKCENLTAYLDKFVSFREGQNQNQNAKIDRILCDKNVYIEETKVDERGQRAQQSRLLGSHMSMDNLEGGTNLSGPGEAWVLAKGSGGIDIVPIPSGGTPAPVDKMEWKLTHIKFGLRMYANVKANTKNAKFFGYNAGVEVFHFPTTDINARMDPNRMGKDQLWLRCGELHVEGRQTGDRTTQYMLARHNCEFRTEKYLGYADLIKFDEGNETVIFESTNGNRVQLFEFQPGNQQPRPMSINSTKVLYNRRTGSIESAGVKSITN